MNKESLDNYMELPDRNGIQTLFRKFDTDTWIFQFNKKEKYIGQVCVSEENMRIIQKAPCIKAGDGKTKQTI
jgi:hypothetical protein